MDSLKKMKKISVIWGIVMILIFGLLTFVALNWKKSDREYKKLEELLVSK